MTLTTYTTHNRRTTVVLNIDVYGQWYLAELIFDGKVEINCTYLGESCPLEQDTSYRL